MKKIFLLLVSMLLIFSQLSLNNISVYATSNSESGKDFITKNNSNDDSLPQSDNDNREIV